MITPETLFHPEFTPVCLAKDGGTITDNVTLKGGRAEFVGDGQISYPFHSPVGSFEIVFIPDSDTDGLLYFSAVKGLSFSSGTVTMSGFTIYVNGVLDGTVLAGVENTIMCVSTGAFTYANMVLGTSGVDKFAGSILDFSVTSALLTAKDAELSYSGALYNPLSRSGLIGEWELSLANTRGSEVVDTSPFSNDGAITGTTLTFDHYGLPSRARDINGSGDKITIGDTGQTMKSCLIIFNPDANNRSIIDFDGGTHSIEITAGNLITATGWNSPIIYNQGVEDGVVVLDGWNMALITTATGIDVNNMVIGQEASYFDGTISVVRIIDYMMSPTEYEARWNNYKSNMNIFGGPR